MKRTLLAAIPAALALLAFSGIASANPRQQCYYGYGCGGFCLNLFGKMHQHGPLFNYGPYYGYPPFEPYGPWNAYLQYNPWYYGYGGQGHGHGHDGHLKSWLHGLFHGHGCGGCGLAEGWHSHFLHGGWFHGHGCLSCSGHKHGFGGGLFHKSCDGCGHGGGGLFHHSGKCGHGADCGTPCTGGPVGGCGGKGCTAASFDPETTDPIARYSGTGSTVEFAGFYAGLPTLSPDLTPVGGIQK